MASLNAPLMWQERELCVGASFFSLFPLRYLLFPLSLQHQFTITTKK
jgi:hypothetical protein